MNIKSGTFKKEELPKARNAYPWHLLNKVNDYFEWDKTEDAAKIRNAGGYQKFKISVRKGGSGLFVIRVS